ncbi:hypothetical protein EN808_17230 [Mesorhizobium sp. M8A.F.Ca.ET.165.01.1.1]|nr:hypothetical protein EN808_17230 [Mesorhizobium sp. M8A.F.Ca.ET.165.01.1.1]TIT67551.1 MAG: hypothetical protein E5W90_06525 [Mesorhizobium sp.]
MKEWLASIFELCLYRLMQKLNPLRVDSASSPALPGCPFPSDPASSSPAGSKREADCLDASASRPVRPSAAAGTAGAAAPRGSGPPFDAAAGCFLIRTQDRTVIADEPTTGRAVSAPDRDTARPRLDAPVDRPG